MKIAEGIFCSYVTGDNGAKCLMYCPDKSGKCDRHKSLTEKPRKEKGKKFRGNSKWQKEQGKFNNKIE